jgi:N-acetylmuramoyl-L-alanine amidase
MSRRLLSLGAALLLPAAATAQLPELMVDGGAGASFAVPVSMERGFAAVPDEILSRLGWRVELTSREVTATLSDEAVVSLTFASPMFRWGNDVLQYIGEPYVAGGHAWIPLQLVLDFLPARLPDRYRAPAGGIRLDVLTPGGMPDPPAEREVAVEPLSEESAADRPPPAPERRVEPGGAESRFRGVVVIDPGHGGRDPGSVGPGGRREKDIALAVGRALARELEKRGDLDVRLTRDRDELVPIWDRGLMATEWKGDLPGLFISIHANSFPERSSVRGFETYFLSEARTEHERRVAASENAPLALEQGDGAFASSPDLDKVLWDLRNNDYQRQSSRLAEEVQRGMEEVHPGPNRGVKQGPLAVITNALMPAVLVEVGFVTNRVEERLLSRGEFQRELAGSIARAVDRFLDRYPPASGAVGSRRR